MINEVIWTEERVEHIAAHNITPDEFEEVCFGQSLVLRTSALGKNQAYHVLGQTADGHYLFCVLIHFPDGNAFPVTARPMTPKEERRYRVWKRR